MKKRIAFLLAALLGTKPTTTTLPTTTTTANPVIFVGGLKVVQPLID